jgi:CpeT protein
MMLKSISPRSLYTAAVVLSLLASCSTARSPRAASRPSLPPDFERLLDWMSGSFSSAAQAAEDTAFYDIRLEMAPIWPQRDDGVWLYVEQAMAGYLDRPYRQRVYHLTQEAPGVFRSTVYALREPTRLSGAWREPGRLDTLGLADLDLRQGCDIVLTWQEAEKVFTGATGEQSCDSNLRGARWASSEVRIGPQGMITWDRGLDAEGKQVWGATSGGYRFDKVETARR